MLKIVIVIPRDLTSPSQLMRLDLTDSIVNHFIIVVVVVDGLAEFARIQTM